MRTKFVFLFIFVFGILRFGSTQNLRCGKVEKTTLNKVVGGETVSDVEYPWFVSFTQGTDSVSVVCGGSLISPKHILTAAHCYAEYPKVRWNRLYKLVYNLEDRCDRNNSSAGPQASKVEIHRRYRSSGLMYDIALVTLQKKTQLVPICLPAPGIKSAEGEVIGFGSDLPRAAVTTRYPCKLQRAVLPILTRQQCLKSGIGPTVRSLSGVVCAGLTQGGVDTCDGDSGGPLQVNVNGRYVLRGIVSFGYGCARRDMPGVYTDVLSYLDWILVRVQQSSTNIITSFNSTTTKPSTTPFFSFTSRFPWFTFSIPH